MEYQVSFINQVGSRGEVSRWGGDDGLGHFRPSYQFDSGELLSLAGSAISPAAADFAEVMFAIHLADRICPRRGSSEMASRRIRVSIPVRIPDHWNSEPVLSPLLQLLSWLTGDSWDVCFVQRRGHDRWIKSQPPLFQLGSPGMGVMLNSGGLDSLIGLAQLSNRDIETPLIPVTTGSQKIIGLAECVVDSVRHAQLSRRSVGGLRVPVQLHLDQDFRFERDSAWRARVLFPLAIGITAAHLVGARELTVFENGIGAIALPMTRDHAGPNATRSMQPKTLRLFSAVASRILGREMFVKNNGLFMTKQGAVRKFIPDALADSVRLTNSCPRWSYTKRPCGNCTSCLLRRLSLAGTRFEEMLPPVHNRTLALTAMEMQVELLRDELSQSPEEFGRSHVELSEAIRYAVLLGMKRQEAEWRIKNLFERHVVEFDAFLSSQPIGSKSRRTATAQLIEGWSVAA